MTVSVAYLGPQGTFTYQAATALARAGVWGPNVDFHPADSPAACVALVRAGTCVGACLADESSVDGPVAQTLDALAGGGVEIVAETDLPIAFSILTRPGADTPRTVATHPVAHQQIRDWLREHLPDAEFLPASSNAAAAQLVAEGEADAAAAPAACAELFGLTTLASGVADVAARTRLIAVRARTPPPPTPLMTPPAPGWTTAPPCSLRCAMSPDRWRAHLPSSPSAAWISPASSPGPPARGWEPTASTSTSPATDRMRVLLPRWPR